MVSIDNMRTSSLLYHLFHHHQTWQAQTAIQWLMLVPAAVKKMVSGNRGNRSKDNNIATYEKKKIYPPASPKNTLPQWASASQNTIICLTKKKCQLDRKEHYYHQLDYKIGQLVIQQCKGKKADVATAASTDKIEES